jgi:hypothetical protein
MLMMENSPLRLASLEHIQNSSETPRNLDQVQIAADRATIWVHALDGSTIGRFSLRFGIDIHTTAREQLAGASQCLHCTHQRPTYAQWLRFCQLMQELHGVSVPKYLLTNAVFGSVTTRPPKSKKNPYPISGSVNIPHEAAPTPRPWATVRNPHPRAKNSSSLTNALPLSMQTVAAKIRKLTSAEIDPMINSLQACLIKLRAGTAHMDHLMDFDCAIILAELIEKQGVVRGLSEPIADAACAVACISQRSDKADGHVGPVLDHEISALHELVSLHKFQLEQISRGEYEKLLRSLAGKVATRLRAT